MKKLFFILLISVTYISTFSQNTIVFLDVSGSMKGINGENIIPQLEPQMENFVSSLDSGKVTVITFTNKIWNQYEGRDLVSQKIKIQSGNTDLSQMTEQIKNYIKKDTTNIIFFITDCKHNTSTIDNVISSLNDIKDKNTENNYYNLVALTPEIRNTAIAKVFDGKNNFTILDSLYLPAINNQNQAVNAKNNTFKRIATPKNQITTNDSWLAKLWRMLANLWEILVIWWWLILIVIIILVLYFCGSILLNFFLPLLKSLQPPAIFKNIGFNKSLDGLKNDEIDETAEGEKCEIPKKMKPACDAISKKYGSLYWMSPQHMKAIKKKDGSIVITTGHPQTTAMIGANRIIYCNSGSYTDKNGKICGDLNLFLQQENLLPNSTYVVDGQIKFTTDSQCRVKTKECNVSNLYQDMKSKGIERNGQRDTATQSAVRNMDGLPGDESSHDIPRELGGSNESYNQTPWNGPDQRPGGNPNSWGYIENKMVKDCKNGKDVRVKTKYHYKGNSRRPTGATRKITTNGKTKTYELKNNPVNQ